MRDFNFQTEARLSNLDTLAQPLRKKSSNSFLEVIEIMKERDRTLFRKRCKRLGMVTAFFRILAGNTLMLIRQEAKLNNDYFPIGITSFNGW